MTRQQPSNKNKAAAANKSAVIRRRRGLEAIASTLPRVAARALGRRGFADAGLLAAWPQVVGKDLAESSAPLRLTFPNRQERRDGNLLLRVEPGIALELQHLAPQLVERVNVYFGYRAVARLTLQQGPLPNRRPPEPKTVIKKLGTEDPLNRQLEQIDDEELRTTLERFSESFRAQQKRRGAKTKGR